MSLQTQFITLWMMFVCGHLLGGILDLYRVVSAQLRMARWLVPMFDVLYWLGAMVLVFRILYWANLGEVRLFIFLGLLAGFVVYYVLFSTYIIRFVRRLLHGIAVLARFLARLFRIFVIMPLAFIIRTLLAVLMFFGTASIFLCKFVLQLVYPVWKLLRNPLIKAGRALRLHVVIRWTRKWITRFKRRL